MIISLVSNRIFTKKHADEFLKFTGESILIPDGTEEIFSALPEAEILITFGSMDIGMLKLCGKLKWIFSITDGVEKLPFDALIEKGIKVTNTKGVRISQIAEHAVGLMISFSRLLYKFYGNQLKRKWEQYPIPDQLGGKTLCIVGAGSIGREVARKATAFDMRIIGIKKHPEQLENFESVSNMTGLSAALKQADYSVLTVPLTGETFHIIGKEAFQSMKSGCFFINVSRGDTVDEEALVEALKDGKLGGAGLDVFHDEPLPETSLLWSMENVIITPHIAGFSRDGMRRVLELFAKSLNLYRKGLELPNSIDLIRKY